MKCVKSVKCVKCVWQESGGNQQREVEVKDTRGRGGRVEIRKFMHEAMVTI